jgi:hypothetical protein
MSRIRIMLGNVVVTATLNDTKTAQLVRDALPFDASAKLWGDEVYFNTPVTAGEEDAQPDVPSGTVAYWPSGKSKVIRTCWRACARRTPCGSRRCSLAAGPTARTLEV